MQKHLFTFVCVAAGVFVGLWVFVAAMPTLTPKVYQAVAYGSSSNCGDQYNPCRVVIERQQESTAKSGGFFWLPESN